MVEECEERLSEDQMESLIKLITTMLPGEQEEEGAEGEEGEEG